MTNTGWICPRCNRALAPHVNECPHCAPAPATPWPVAPYVPPLNPWAPWWPTIAPYPLPPFYPGDVWVTSGGATTEIRCSGDLPPTTSTITVCWQ